MTNSDQLWEQFVSMNFNQFIEREIFTCELMIKRYSNHIPGNNSYFLVYQMYVSKLVLLKKIKRS